MGYEEAKALAAKMRGRLLEIASAEENDFVFSTISGCTWLGLEWGKGRWANPQGVEARLFLYGP